MSPLVYDGSTVESNCEKANLINTYFHGYFNTNTPVLIHQAPILDPTGFPQDYLCTEDEIYYLITNLDYSESSGPDGITLKMLKATAASIAQVLLIFSIYHSEDR